MPSVGTQPKSSAKPGRTRAILWALLILTPVILLVLTAIPVWIIQPFKAQTDRGLTFALVLRTWSPLLTLVGTLFVLFLVFKLWKGSRWWGKAIVIIPVGLSLFTAWFTRQNYFEWMFQPLPAASFAPIREASYVEDADQVMAVRINGEAAAYPIREMAYHHIVQDTVGNDRIVVTY